ncbi:MAG: hypothetical protein WCS92_04215 [Candidatus Babeliales bacterium]
MKFSIKRLLFLTVGFLTVCLNVTPMTTTEVSVPAEAAEVSKFFGGASSAAELQSRVAENFDQYGMVTEIVPCPWYRRLLNSFSSTSVPAVCTEEQRELIRPGTVDAKLREVAASQVQTQIYIDALKRDSKISDVARAAAIEELELRKKFLSQVGRCHEGLRDDLMRARATVGINTREIDRIAKIGAGEPVVDRDTKIARTVNDAMKAPFERAHTCYNQVISCDSLAQPQAVLGETLVEHKADPYVESNRHVAQVSGDLDRKAAQARKELAQQELTAKCAVSGSSSLDCRWNAAQIKASAATDWVAGGWEVLGHKIAAVEAPDFAGMFDVVRDYGVNDISGCSTIPDMCIACEHEMDVQMCRANPYEYYAIQSGKVAGGVALAAVGLYAAYKLSKLGWRGACALKNALWTNRSKKARAAILMALGSAVAVAPSVAMQYGLMPQ